MVTFEQLQNNDPIKEVIQSAFDAEFDISGGWGYTMELATVIHDTKTPPVQLEHMLASMRTYIEMNMTLFKEERFGSINLNEIKREHVVVGKLLYDKVTYEITAMNEMRYNEFINEYKEGYGKTDFDMTTHFKERKKETLTRTEDYWFEVHHIKKS